MNKADREHLSKIVALGCIACRNMGHMETPAEVHHLRKGVGRGQKSVHKRSIPLCPPHHRTGGYGIAIHAGIQGWEALHGSEEDLLEQVMGLL